LLFRYRILPTSNALPAAACADAGTATATPLQSMFTRRSGPASEATLPAVGGFLRISNPAVQMLAFKPAEDGDGWILRLWNPSPETLHTQVELPGRPLAAAACATLTEEPASGTVCCRGGAVEVSLDPAAVITLRLGLAAAARMPAALPPNPRDHLAV
jgi:alpha-mannosidase